MPSSASNPSSRWHFVNLVPIWISQGLNSFAAALLPFFCFMSCGSYRPAFTAAPIVCLISFVTIAAEACFFFARRLNPAGSLVFQVAKFVVVGAQWLVMVMDQKVGNGRPDESLLSMMGQALLFAVFSLPFSVHLGYAIISYVSFVASGGLEKAKESGSEAQTALMKDEDGPDSDGMETENDENASSSVADELQWPPRGKLVPNWILQLVYTPVLWLLRNMPSSSWNKSGWFSKMLTYMCLAVLICSTCYEIYQSVKKVGQRLSSRDYLKLQVIKIVSLYLLLDLVVLAWGGWMFQIGNWGLSLFGVFILSILFGSPFIAECVFAASEHQSYWVRMRGQNGIQNEQKTLG